MTPDSTYRTEAMFVIPAAVPHFAIGRDGRNVCAGDDFGADAALAAASASVTAPIPPTGTSTHRCRRRAGGRGSRCSAAGPDRPFGQKVPISASVAATPRTRSEDTAALIASPIGRSISDSHAAAAIRAAVGQHMRAGLGACAQRVEQGGPGSR